MSLLQQFVDFFLNQKPKRSLLTVKNYKADIRQFISWFEKEFKFPFDPSKITMQILQKYRKTRDLSESSIERHTSSLRKFFNFLKIKGIISQDPLEKKTASAEALAKEDPWMIRNFKNFLYEYKKSNLTIKNYINDIKSFFVWLGEVALVRYSWNVADRNLLDKINFSVIEEYKQRLIAAKFSPATINRKLSSLRNYISWAKSQGLISSGHAEFTPASQPNEIPKQVEDTPRGIQDDKVAYSSFPPTRLMRKSLRGINSLFDNLFILPLAQTLEATQYLFWKTTGKRIFKKTVIPKSFRVAQPNEISNIKKSFYAPLNVSTRYLPTHKRIWHYIRHVRPNWYKKYHSYPFTHYFHFAILMIFSCAVGFGMYNGLFADAQKENSVLGTSTSAPPRILSFQGKLTDSSEAPITKETAILFSLYDDEDASAGAALWQENDTVKPDSDGVFSVFLGKKTPIPNTAFNQNSRLFLGITVGNSPELQPRQELATVPFASNAETLRGLEPITNTAKASNVVLALDSSGNLTIAGAKAHAFQVIGGQFVLSGKVLSLTTVPGSNSNIEIVPNGIGKIDLSKPIQNSTNNNNLTSAVGSVEFDDTVAILATTSAQAALYINQNSTGTLISASTSGTAKFVVENDGTGKFTGDLGVNGGDLTSAATIFNLLNSTVTTLNIGGAATTLNIGVSGGTTSVKSNLTVDKDFTLPSLTSNGGILYTNGSGKILQVSAGSSSQCLMGGTTPSFASCSGTSIFNQANGTTYVGNTTMDVLFGGTATSSAKFGFINIASGAPTATIGGNLSLAVPATAGTSTLNLLNNSNLNIKVSPGGDAGLTSSLFIQNNGNVGIGTTSPAAPFEVKGTGTGITIAKFTDSNTTGCTLTTGGTISCSSDVRLKKNFENISYGLDAIMALKPVAFNWKSENDGATKNLGFIAQEVEQIIPKLVTTDSNGYEQLNTIGLVPVLAKAIQEQQVQIASFSAIIKDVNITSTGNLSIEIQQFNNATMQQSPTPFVLKTPIGDTINRIGAFAELVAANLRAGLINASEIITNTLVVTSDSMIVNGQNLKDYIINVVKDSGIASSDIISPIVNTDQLSTNIISPLSSASLIVKLATPSGSLIVENASGSAVARIDDQGNASFSGTLTADGLQATAVDSSRLTVDGNATISGTLRARNILADSIDGLEAKISNMYSANYADLASYSAQLSYVPDLAAERAQFNQGLMVFGPTSLSDLALAGRLSVGGTMFITENSIEVLGADLSLQSLRQGGLSIMGGLVYIDTEGNIKVQSDLSVTGKLAVNIISPLPTADLVVNNASGSSVLSVNQTGDVVASGSGTFAKLNFSLIAPVLAISATEVIASSSAGVANIAPYQSEITIRNALVTNKSVIYITPVGTPSAQTPFLMRQIPNGSFTVGVQSPTNHPLDFNWLIIN